MQLSDPPVVTGISPIEGVPGTKVTIRGENFGVSQDDLVGLIICGVDCIMSAEWISKAKIVARCGVGVGKGNIILITATGGRGTSTVQFKGLQETVGPLKESAVWVDESLFSSLWRGRKRPMSPVTMLHDDPLGLSTEGNEKNPILDEIGSMLQDQSTELSDTNFSAEKFLLEKHMSTSFHDLLAGLKHIKRKVGNQKEGEIAFLKANAGSVLEQVDTLLELKCKFESDIEEHGRHSTQQLEKVILQCKEEADKLFEDVLKCKDRADSTRSAINVLKRFHFLFFLPVNTERNIQKGDYDVVINDFARAKSLFGDTEIHLFQRFYQEAFKKVEGLQQILEEKLTGEPLPLETQRKIIRNLYHLETDGDPAWKCLQACQSHILKVLVEARDAFLERELSNLDLGSNKLPNSKNTPFTSTPASKYNLIIGSSVGEWQATAPVRILLVEDLSDILLSQFPDLWKLSQAYLRKELLPSDFFISSTRATECEELMMELLSVFSGIIRGAILPSTLKSQFVRKFKVWPEDQFHTLTPWLPQTLRNIKSVHNSFVFLDLPSPAQDIIQSLLFDMRVHCCTCLLQQTVDHLNSLHLQETWIYDIKDDGISTSLPHLCENIIVECVQLIKETVLEASPLETSPLSYPEFNERLGILINNALVAFAQGLEKLALRDPDDENELFENSLREDGRTESVELQILITLNNCCYTKDNLLPKIQNTLIKMEFPKEEISNAVRNASETFIELEERLFEAYLEERLDPIIGAVERSMYLGQFDWGKVRRTPNNVSSYVQELLLNMAQVHSEVAIVSSDIGKRILIRVADSIAEEISRLLLCVTSFSTSGRLQAIIDVSALNRILRDYLSSNGIACLQEVITTLPDLVANEKKLKDEILQNFYSRMEFLFSSFQ